MLHSIFCLHHTRSDSCGILREPELAGHKEKDVDILDHVEGDQEASYEEMQSLKSCSLDSLSWAIL